ncbi:MAG: histidine phosphatase family protein [Spirochaetota bacterium]
MKIILVQHGDAVASEKDPERPLSDKGRSQVKRLSEFLRRLPFYPALILHSGKQRARETAETVSFALGGVRVEERPYLGPDDPIRPMEDELKALGVNVLIVGHLPQLKKLTGALLAGDEKRDIVEISNASPIIIDREKNAFRLDGYFRCEYMK